MDTQFTFWVYVGSKMATLPARQFLDQSMPSVLFITLKRLSKDARFTMQKYRGRYITLLCCPLFSNRYPQHASE